MQASSLKDDEVDVAIASTRFYSLVRPIGRTARIAAALSPNEIEKINKIHERIKNNLNENKKITHFEILS